MSRDPLEDLAGVCERAAEAAAHTINEGIQDQYRQGMDPNGSPWAPLAKSTIMRGRHAPPLTDTGAMAAGTEVTVEGTSLVATLPSPGQYHQSGTSRMPQRQILPEGGLSPAWEKAILDAVEAEVVKCLGL